MVMAEDEVTIKVSGLKERIVIYGFALLVGGATVIDLVSPHGRHDPFTGAQGSELDERITVLELEHEILKQRSSECEADLADHLKTATAKIKQYEIKFTELEIRVNECLRRLYGQ